MAMVYDYDSGPAWRKNLGLSPETWVDDSESYGVRYVPQGAAPSMSRRRPGYVSPSTLPQDQADFNYARQAEALGTTANYLMYGYARDKGELSAAVRQGDAERARLVRDRMLRWTDEHRDSLTEWSVVANGLGGTADRFAQNAQAILQESYLDEGVATSAVDRSGRPVGGGMTARDFLGSKTPEAKAYAAEAAKRKLNLGSDAAAIFSDPDNPLYDALMTQRRDYMAAADAFGKAADDEVREKARRSQQRATLSLQNAAEFAAAHQDSPEAVRDFLSGIGSSQWFANVSRGEMDDYFRMYAKDVEAGKVRNSADWFGELSQAFSSIGPTQRRIEFDKNGARRVVTEPSEFTRPERIPGMFVKAREILEGSGRDVDLSALSASLRQNVQKADVIARMAGVHDPQLLGLGDAAVASTVYSYSGNDSGLLNASYRGQALVNTGRTLDDAYANAVKLANVMGVNLDEATPVNGASSDSPGLLGSTQLDVYRAVLRHSLRGGPGDEDGLRNELADIFSRSSSADGAHDYQGLADAVYDKITRNMQAGFKMDLEQVLREIGGGLQVGTTRTQDGRVVPVMQRVVPPGNRAAVDYATGRPMVSDPDAGEIGALTTDPKVRKSLSPADVYAADKALESVARRETGAIPYAKVLEDAGRRDLIDSVSSVANGILAVHRAHDYGTARGRELDHMYEGVASSVGNLLFDNMQQLGVKFKEDSDAAFVKSDLVPFLDGFDKWFNFTPGESDLSERAIRFADSLADQVLAGENDKAPLFARVAVELVNRGFVPGPKTQHLLTTIGLRNRLTHHISLSGQASFNDWTVDDSHAGEVYKDAKVRLSRMFGAPSFDILESAGYKDGDIGKLRRSNDYAKIFRVFDLNWRKKAPVVSEAVPDAQAVQTAQTTPNGGQASPDARVASTANYVLSTQMSTDDELAFLMGRLASNVSTELADPKAVQDFAALMMPLVRERLRREGSAAALDLVDRQGKLRRHISKATSGSNPFQDGLITKEQQDELIENVYGGDRNAYNKAQKQFLAEKQKFDYSYLTRLGTSTASDENSG